MEYTKVISQSNAFKIRLTKAWCKISELDTYPVNKHANMRMYKQETANCGPDVKYGTDNIVSLLTCTWVDI